MLLSSHPGPVRGLPIMIPEKARMSAATRADVTTDKTKERGGPLSGSIGSAETDKNALSFFTHLLGYSA